MPRFEFPPTKLAGNPRIPLGSAGSWYEKQIFDPVVLPHHSDSSALVMFVSGMAAPVATGLQTIGRLTSTVANPLVWSTPTQVLTNGGVGAWDNGGARLGGVLYVGGTYYMYYTGGPAGGGTRIGLATSSDGITWTKHASNPVLTPTGQGRNDGDNVSEPAVWFEGGSWTMIYSYRNGSTILPGYRYATSSDGISWTKGGSGDILTVAPLYGEFHQILKIDGEYWLQYESGGSTASQIPYRIFMAKSTTNTVIGPYVPTRFGPVLSETNQAGTWDRYHVATACVFQAGSRWLMAYVGASDLFQPYWDNTWPMGFAEYVDFVGQAGGGGPASGR